MGTFSLLGGLLERVGDEVVQKRLCEELSGKVVEVTNTNDNGGDDEQLSREKQMGMLSSLFNLRTDGVEKVRILIQIINLANVEDLSPNSNNDGVSSLCTLLEPESLVTTMASWGDVPEVEKRGVYRAIVGGMDRLMEKMGSDDVKDVEDRKQTYLLLILDTYKDESSVDKEALTNAQQATVGAISNPIDLFSTQHRLLHLPAVKALQKSSSTAPLYDLLKILHEGKLQDYRDFTSMPDKSGVFAAFSLNEAECAKNMMLLSLVSLAGEHEEIPYSAIASTLDIGEDQVEKWVILGVSSGLMEAKMDQLSKVVIVERCVVRQFGRKEWEALKVRLDKWKVNVRGVLDALKSASE